MKIVAIDCHVLLVPKVDTGATSSAQDNLVVFIRTDAGITGVGESDANPWMLRAAIEAPGTHTMGLGLKEMLLGTDPLRPAEEIWQRLYDGSAMNGRRGIVIHAMGALDVGLWDIKGKAANAPIWQLLLRDDDGAALFGATSSTTTDPPPPPPPTPTPPRDHIVPYASLQPETFESFAEYRDSLVKWAVRAKDLGFAVCKIECTLVGPYAHCGLDEPDPARVTEVLAAVRAAVGPAMTILVDVQYAYEDPRVVAALVAEWRRRGLDIFFVETPLRMDLVEEMAELHRLIKDEWDTAAAADGGTTNASPPTMIAYGEWQATRFEMLDLVERGHIDVVQPDVGRIGGLTEARRVCRMAQAKGRVVVPHCWKTMIGIAATAHLAAAFGCRFIEFLPAELTGSPMRQRLTTDDEFTAVVDGRLPLPQRPGIGVHVDMGALREFERHAEAAFAKLNPPVAAQGAASLLRA